MSRKESYGEAYFTALFEHVSQEEGQRDLAWLDGAEGPEPGEEELRRFRGRLRAASRRNSRRRIYRIAAKAACIALAVLAGAAAVIVSVEAFRVPVFNFFFSRQATATTVRLRQEGAFTLYHKVSEPASLPDGYVYYDSSDTELSYEVVYRSVSGETLIYRQHGKDYIDTLDTENADLVLEEKIGACPALYIEKDGIHMVSWNDGTYVYCITGTAGKTAILEMAESVRAVPG